MDTKYVITERYLDLRFKAKASITTTAAATTTTTNEIVLLRNNDGSNVS